MGPVHCFWVKKDGTCYLSGFWALSSNPRHESMLKCSWNKPPKPPFNTPLSFYFPLLPPSWNLLHATSSASHPPIPAPTHVLFGSLNLSNIFKIFQLHSFSSLLLYIHIPFPFDWRKRKEKISGFLSLELNWVWIFFFTLTFHGYRKIWIFGIWYIGVAYIMVVY